MVSSGAIMPALAPASMDMLHTVIRLFHRQPSDRVARVLDDVPRGAGRANPADEPEDQIFGRDAGSERACEVRLERLRLGHDEALRGEHMLHLARADPERQRAERAVRGRVRIAAHDHEPRLGGTEELGPMTWTMPCFGESRSKSSTPNALAFVDNVLSWLAATGSAMGRDRSSVGTL